MSAQAVQFVIHSTMHVIAHRCLLKLLLTMRHRISVHAEACCTAIVGVRRWD